MRDGNGFRCPLVRRLDDPKVVARCRRIETRQDRSLVFFLVGGRTLPKIGHRGMDCDSPIVSPRQPAPIPSPAGKACGRAQYRSGAIAACNSNAAELSSVISRHKNGMTVEAPAQRNFFSQSDTSEPGVAGRAPLIVLRRWRFMAACFGLKSAR